MDSDITDGAYLMRALAKCLSMLTVCSLVEKMTFNILKDNL